MSRLIRFITVFCLTCILLILAYFSASAENFLIDTNGVITAVTADTDIEALKITAKVKNSDLDEYVQAARITADFSAFANLKYILIEGSKPNKLPRIDLTGAANAECVYFTLELTSNALDRIEKRIKVNDSVRMLQ
ncbi:MAG: hypothetical protein IJC48_11780 [Clostridia bacterium]|nr:hypothetical protein [Clostridia bacterium]